MKISAHTQNILHVTFCSFCVSFFIAHKIWITRNWRAGRKSFASTVQIHHPFGFLVDLDAFCPGIWWFFYVLPRIEKRTQSIKTAYPHFEFHSVRLSNRNSPRYLCCCGNRTNYAIAKKTVLWVARKKCVKVGKLSERDNSEISFFLSDLLHAQVDTRHINGTWCHFMSKNIFLFFLFSFSHLSALSKQ